MLEHTKGSRGNVFANCIDAAMSHDVDKDAELSNGVANCVAFITSIYVKNTVEDADAILRFRIDEHVGINGEHVSRHCKWPLDISLSLQKTNV